MTTSTTSLISFDPSLLTSYYQAQLAQSTLQATTASNASTNGQTQGTSSSSTSPSSSVLSSILNGGTVGSSTSNSNTTPPWTQLPESAVQQDAQVLSTTNFINTSNTLTPTTGATAKTQENNQNLFTLYSAINNLSVLASLAQSKTATAGQLQGYNTRFQSGLAQVQQFIQNTTFNGFTLQAGTASNSITSTATVPLPTFGYTGGTIVSDANVGNALANVSTSDSFNIAVTANGTTTNVAIDFSQIQGPLTVDNIVNYINQQLKAAGSSTTFSRVVTQGSINDPTSASYGIQINEAPGETVSLSATNATPSLYLAGDSGISSAEATQSAITSASSTSSSTSSSSNSSATTADQQGRLVKLTNVGSGSTPQSVFSATTTPSSGLTTAQSTVVDSQGNVYVLGNATGNFGSQINQGSQDVYLSKYDSAGNLQWTKLVGSNGSASAYSLAVDPNGGGVVVAGSTTANLTQTSVADGNSDTFVASYDQNGNENWVQQLPTLTNNQPTTVSVDLSGNVYVGGQTSTTVGQSTSSGNTQGYVAEFDSNGNIVNQTQVGTTGSNTVAATAMTSDGGLVVASVQNGEAFLTKYANGNTSSTPVWQEDLGALNAGGTINGITVSGNQIYLSGTTSNANLTAGGQATVANASTGGTNAFVFNVTDQGTSATPNFVTYVGNTSGSTQAGGLTVGPDGTIYLTGTTTGTFAGAARNVPSVNNMFATAIASNGAIDWTQQFGGADGQSTGQGIAVDPQGSSVLDALGLPHGTINENQSVALSSATTLQAGDSFSIQIQSANGAASRTAQITIGQDATLDSLVTQINGELVNAGKASVVYSNGGEALKIQMNSGFTGTLISGPTDFDALSRLGIQPGVLSGSASSSSSSSKSSSSSNSTNTSSTGNSSTSSSSSTPQVFGLGLDSAIPLNLTTATGAGATNATLLNVLSNIRNIYQTINAPPQTASTTPQQNQGPVSAETTAQIADYNLALNLLTASSSGASTQTSTSSLVSLFA